MLSRGAIRPSSAVRAPEGEPSDIRRKGQAMIETVIVVIFLSLTFLWLFQYANLFTTKLLLTHAAARAARARAVGLNELMVWKSSRVATIPVAGKCLSTFDGDSLTPEQEVARIPEFLAAENYADLHAKLVDLLYPLGHERKILRVDALARFAVAENFAGQLKQNPTILQFTRCLFHE